MKAWGGNPRRDGVDAIGKDHLIVQDLGGKTWSDKSRFWDASWRWGILPNSGGRNGLHGDLRSVATALLLAASLAPTDPVLAADVQVGPPRTGDEDEVRFGLTSEAGLNDGAAVPFVHLATLLAVVLPAGRPWVVEWLTYRVVWEVLGGIVVGWPVGRAFGWLTIHVPAESKLAQTGDGLIALLATFVTYGLTEMLHVYGFLAVFVTALAIRHTHREHQFQADMHAITEQIERLAMMGLLILFGGALIGGLLAPVTWIDVVVALVNLVIARPATGWLARIGHGTDRAEKLTLAFLGIRGVGSNNYLAYGINYMPVADPGRLWASPGSSCCCRSFCTG